MKHVRWIRLLSLVIVMIGVCTFTSLAASDDKAPLVKSYQTDKAHYEYGEPITFTLEIEEDGTGVSFINISVTRKINATMSSGCSYQKSFDTPLYSGTYTFTLKKDPETFEPLPDGSYTLSSIQIDDAAGNIRTYSGPDVFTGNEDVQFINCDTSDDICSTPAGTGFTIGDFEVDSIKVESFRFDADEVDDGSAIPVSLHLSGGNEGEEYSAYMCFEKSGGNFLTHTIKFNYAEDVSLSFPISETGFGRCWIHYLKIKKSSSKEYKTYSGYYQEDDVIAYSEDDKCRIDGKRYINLRSINPGERCPELLSVEISPESLTKPGYIKGKVAFDVPYSSIKTIDVSFAGKGTYTSRYKNGIRPGTEGSFSIAVGTSTPANDYYIDRISLLDIYGNEWSFQGAYFSEEENCYLPYIDKDGRQYFTYENEFGDIKTIYPEFTGAKYVTVKDEFDVAFHSSLNDPQLIDRIASLQTGETGLVEISGDFIASAGMFEALAGKDASIVFTHENYQWVFNGLDITEPKDVDLHIKFVRADGEEYTSDGDALMITFPKNGTLPGKANIRIKSDYTYKMYKLHKGIYLYYFNDKANNLELESDSGIRAYLDDSDSWCSFDITHNSRFLAASSKLKETAVPLAKGRTFRSGAFTYKVIQGRKLAVIKVKSKLIRSAVIPATVKYRNATYKVATINASVFTNCKRLTSVAIGKNISFIGKSAFYNCPRLKKVTIRSALLSKTKVGSKAFGKINSRAVVKVPSSKLKTYKAMLKARGLTGKRQIVKKL